MRRGPSIAIHFSLHKINMGNIAHIYYSSVHLKSGQPGGAQTKYPHLNKNNRNRKYKAFLQEAGKGYCETSYRSILQRLMLTRKLSCTFFTRDECFQWIRKNGGGRSQAELSLGVLQPIGVNPQGTEAGQQQPGHAQHSSDARAGGTHSSRDLLRSTSLCLPHRSPLEQIKSPETDSLKR